MMIHPDFQGAMARERSATMAAAAAAHRQARQLRRAGQLRLAAPTPGVAGPVGRPAGAGGVVRRGGSAVLIRPVRSTDAPLLADGFARLSERSRRLRFLGRKNTLTEAD